MALPEVARCAYIDSARHSVICRCDTLNRHNGIVAIEVVPVVRIGRENSVLFF